MKKQQQQQQKNMFQKERIKASILMFTLFNVIFFIFYFISLIGDAKMIIDESNENIHVIFKDLGQAKIIGTYDKIFFTNTFEIGLKREHGEFIIQLTEHRKNEFIVIFFLLTFLFGVNNIFLFSLTSNKKVSSLIEASKQGGQMSEKTLSLLSENIHHELKTPLIVITHKLEQIKEIFTMMLCDSKSLNRRKADKLLLENEGCTGEDDDMGNCKSIKDFELITTHIDVIHNVMNRMKDFKNMKADTKDRSIYDIIDVSFKTLKMFSKNDFTYSIDIKFKQYNVVSLQNEDIINIFINHIKNALEANATDINVYYIDFSNSLLSTQIIDNGSGIPKEVQDKVFNTGVSTKEVSMDGETRGVGLYLSKYTLNNFGGDDFLIESDERGTSFGISVPSKRR